MPNMSYMARDSVHETKGAIRDAGKAASAAAGDIQDDLLALRDNVAKLTLQITAIVAAAAAPPGAGRDRTSKARSRRSSQSAPRSSRKRASSVTRVGSTPKCPAMIVRRQPSAQGTPSMGVLSDREVARSRGADLSALWPRVLPAAVRSLAR
jgi:hypothetical protein